MVVRAPADMPDDELNRIIEKLKARLEKKLAKEALSDRALDQRARLLNKRYFKGKLKWKQIRWVSNQNRRFGSCSPRSGTIRISHRVGSLPQFVQDYVIVHELAHLLEPNHSPAFWKLVNRYPLTERAIGYLIALGLNEEDDSPAP